MSETTYNATGQNSALWSYAKCPDVDECLLGLHDCHTNATCANRDPGYNCTCNRGFEGNGRDVCARTCYESCRHGFCTGDPEYRCECDLGWSGVDCSVDCGCHNHSTCSTHGPGTCDQCREWTTGEQCHLCKASGKCYCVHNAEGHHCHLCSAGYYGDPRDGGHCYLECGARTVVPGARAGHLGAQVGGPDTPTSCLWIITADENFPPEDLVTDNSTASTATPATPGTSVIQLTVEATNVDCDNSIVYIYDGLPDFISTPRHNHISHMLAAFCHTQATFPTTVEAVSGIMTVYFERNDSKMGFNASYDVLRCPENPGDRRVVVTQLLGAEQIWPGDPHLATVLQRLGHSLVVDQAGSLWVFGGLSLARGPLNDVQRFDPYNGTSIWQQVTVTLQPVVGPKLTPHLAAAAAANPPALYLFGGFNGTSRGSLLSVRLPPDLCGLSSNQSQCLSVVGCASCEVYGATNASYCYSNSGREPAACRSPQAKMKSVGGVLCLTPPPQDNCGTHRSCAECLGDWPSRPETTQRCQWCHSLSRGRCLPQGSNCPSEELCHSGGGCHSVREAVGCREGACVASDCDKCKGRPGCIWTRQVGRRTKAGHYELQEKPSLDWNCVNTTIQQHLSYPVAASPPGPCPMRCHTHATCHECLEAEGAEGGWHECRWSDTLGECISPSYLPLRCLGGACGLVVAGGPSQCPQECPAATQCSQCLAQPKCGWCALNSTLGGLGQCTKGTLQGPHQGPCHTLDYSHLNASLVELHDLQPPLQQSTWHYLTCPPEDECGNGHHACEPDSQTCRDLTQGYTCPCAPGYNMTSTDHCRPLCSQGCLKGTCVRPNTCECNFGYVGANCSTECLCNGHSDCAGPLHLTTCLHCHNNTRGSQCHLCRHLYVGDPAMNLPCVPCTKHCHGHATTCLPPTPPTPVNTTEPPETPETPEKNPVTLDAPETSPKGEAVCQGCANHTTGPRCESCNPGYFRGSGDLALGCRPCQCNGHGSHCDPIWGTNCDCGNNTETEKQCTEAGSEEEECWQHQCAKSVCVVVWKVKQGLDLRRLRRRHMVEMLHMARRPCATTTLLLHTLDTPDIPPDNTLWSPRRKRTNKTARSGDSLGVGPLAVEPTDDGVAAVLTLMVQLPGGGLGGEVSEPNTPTHRLALGSSLCLMSRIFPPASRPFHLRRRTSHLAS
ncbi:Multiple epidermal growth factor-like domains protein 8 [Chionoecetes opilio]|uniref:Multiple epidermal growth factor-like domains protein 8 n=1 Tax=Chionoecetes opilio TaxID=41210 RepID=A0A8J4YQZ1_CHIOP|nr:Multiple epidermal growth factor-like domains protein 8 [Chionoecetes opilio]